MPTRPSTGEFAAKEYRKRSFSRAVYAPTPRSRKAGCFASVRALARAEEKYKASRHGVQCYAPLYCCPFLGILIITPEGPLQQADFEALTQLIYSFIESEGKLRGLLIYAESFPGWADFASLVAHL